MKFLALILASLLLNACAGLRDAPRIIAVCPAPPLPQCVPGHCSIPPFDTSVTSGSASEGNWRISQVAGLNTQADEWSLSFITPGEALATVGSGNQMRLYGVTLSSTDSAVTRPQLEILVAGAIGSASVVKQMYFGVYPLGNLEGDADVYHADFSGSVVQDPRSFVPISKAGSWESQPACSADGNVIFFASDREGGVGGTDIWYVRKLSNGSWSEAINAGESINTICDELTPFVTVDGKQLLFTSSGHDTYGGYDIFQSDISPGLLSLKKATQIAQHFSKALNLGSPLNTTADEIFPSSPALTGDVLYYSSNQRGGSGFDEYVRYRSGSGHRKEKKIAAKTQEETKITKQAEKLVDSVTVHGKVYNTSRKLITTAEVRAGETTEKKLLTNTTTDKKGEYSIHVPTDKDLELSAQYEEGFYDSYKVRFNSRDTVTSVEHDFIIPEILYLRLNFPTDKFQDPYNNVLDSNGVESNQAWMESIDLVAVNLKKFGKNIRKVVLVGHTDENGSNEYNFALGKKRVNFVVDELVKRGLPKTMFETRSAGELEPLPRRKDEANEVFYKRNRRVELSKVMK